MNRFIVLSSLFVLACGGNVDIPPPPDASDAAPDAVQSSDVSELDVADAGSDVCYPAMQACPDVSCGWTCMPCALSGFGCPNGDTSAVVYVDTCTQPWKVATCDVEQARCGSSCAYDGGVTQP